MTVRYHERKGESVPDYVCQNYHLEHGGIICQHIPGSSIEKAIGDLLIEIVNPVALGVALEVQRQLSYQLEESDKLRKKQVERARYEADLSRRRYMQVDPSNRLVADTLEAEWNEKLRILADVQEEYEHRRLSDQRLLDEQQKEAIAALASDFPRIWNDPKTKNRDRKRMVHLIIEDVTIIKEKEITLNIRLKGGATKILKVAIPLHSWETWKTPQEIVDEIDRLLNHHPEDQICHILNKRGLKPGKGGIFTPRQIASIRREYGLKSRYERLRESGMLTMQEISEMLGVHEGTVKKWKKNGLLKAYRCDAKQQYLYEHPGDNSPVKMQGVKLSKRRIF